MEFLVNKKISSNSSESMSVENLKKLNGEDKEALIALRAYYKSEERGYEPGREIQDWLEAEAEVMAEMESEKQ